MGNYGMKREIHIKDNGKFIKRKDGVYIIQKKKYFLEENGLPTNKTVSGSKDGREEVLFFGEYNNGNNNGIGVLNFENKALV